MKTITVVYGCMFSGKTSWIIDKARSLNSDELVVIKHSIDTRYSECCIVSHNGDKYPAIPANKLLDIDCKVFLGKKYIIIDEGQFFDDIMDFVKITENMDIMIAGLDLTSSKEPFGHMPNLINIANNVIHRTANCADCGKPALYTHRKKENLKESERKSTILIGGSQIYQPMCADCYEIHNIEKK